MPKFEVGGAQAPQLALEQAETAAIDCGRSNVVKPASRVNEPNVNLNLSFSRMRRFLDPILPMTTR